MHHEHQLNGVGVFGLDGEQVIHRARALAAEHAARRELPADASDAQLEAAIVVVRGEVARDRKLRRPLRNATVRGLVDSLITWEVVVTAVGKETADARWHALRGLTPTVAASPDEPPLPDGPSPTVPAKSARSVRARHRRLPDVQVHTGLAGSVHAEASGDDDPLHRDGYEHSLWLEEWLEIAVGAGAFARVEEAVAAHPLVDAAMHMDREVLYVAAPTLHPEDVRQVVLVVLADAFDPEWEQKL
jgi:hypothetical protein